MEGLCLTLGRNVPETEWSDRPGQVHAVSLGGYVTSGKTPVLLGLHVLAFGVGTRHPLFLVSLPVGPPLPKNMGCLLKG